MTTEPADLDPIHMSPPTWHHECLDCGQRWTPRVDCGCPTSPRRVRPALDSPEEFARFLAPYGIPDEDDEEDPA
jgi:hypothetical protein